MTLISEDRSRLRFALGDQMIELRLKGGRPPELNIDRGLDAAQNGFEMCESIRGGGAARRDGSFGIWMSLAPRFHVSPIMSFRSHVVSRIKG